jgi:hypothetical protein
MSVIKRSGVETRLRRILDELERQADVSAAYRADALSFSDEMAQIREYIEVAGEYGAAYESLVATIESHPFVLSGKAAVSLLEVGLLLGYKTDRNEDKEFGTSNRDGAGLEAPPSDN